MSFEVFISYSTHDLDQASRVQGVLEGARAKVFLAEYTVNPSEELTPAITGAIDRCDLFVLLWSASARDSEWVPQEIGYAKGKSKTIMPVMLQRDLELPGFLKGLKYLPLYKDPESGLKWLQENVFKKANKKSRTNGLFWFGIGAALVYLMWPVSNEESV